MTGAEQVPFVCERCNAPITSEDSGVFFIFLTDMHTAFEAAERMEVRRATRTLNANQSGPSIISGQQMAQIWLENQPVVSWHLAHDRCLEEGENDRIGWYQNCGEMSSYRLLFNVYLHLEEKKWMKATNLNQVMRKLV